MQAVMYLGVVAAISAQFPQNPEIFRQDIRSITSVETKSTVSCRNDKAAVILDKESNAYRMRGGYINDIDLKFDSLEKLNSQIKLFRNVSVNWLECPAKSESNSKIRLQLESNEMGMIRIIRLEIFRNGNVLMAT